MNGGWPPPQQAPGRQKPIASAQVARVRPSKSGNEDAPDPVTQSRTALFLLGWPIASAIGQFFGSERGSEKKFQKIAKKGLTSGSRYDIILLRKGKGPERPRTPEEAHGERTPGARTRGVGVAHQGPKAKAGSPGADQLSLLIAGQIAVGTLRLVALTDFQASALRVGRAGTSGSRAGGAHESL